MEAPFKLYKPSFQIGESGSEIELNCAGRKVTFAPGDRQTWCHRDESINLEVVQSFGAEGLWNQLNPLVDTEVPFVFLPVAGKAVGVDNPQAAGTLLVPDYIPFLDAGIREFSPFTLEFQVVGSIAYTTS